MTLEGCSEELVEFIKLYEHGFITDCPYASYIPDYTDK